MFTISEEQYREIAHLIAKYCCLCTGKNWHCAEVECTVQMIYEFLWPHVEWDDAKQDVEKTDLDLIEKELGIDLEDDSLPFRE